MRIPGIKKYRVGHQDFAYHRRTRIRLYAAYGTPAFFEEFAAAEAVIHNEVMARDKVGTLYSACREFQSSGHYRNYPLTTRSAFQEILKWLSDRDAATPLTAVTRNFVIDLRDKATRRRGHRFGNTALVLLQVVLAWNVANGKLKENPANAVPKVRPPKSAPSRDRRRITAAHASRTTI